MLLAVAYGTFFDRQRRHMEAHGFAGFTPRTGFVLRVLDGRLLSLRELADRLEMSSPAALKVIDAMEREGYVERVGHPEDGRVRAVVPTARGYAALEAVHAFHGSVEQDLVDELGADGAAAVRRGLDVLVGQATDVIPQVLRRPTVPR